jgi:ABC-type lipoprotein release transport system permease subunit
VISIISVVGITVASAAMVIVLSTFNGFGALVEDTFNAFDPDLKITPSIGKVFNYHTPEFEEALQVTGVLMISESLEENALFIFNDRQVPVLVKGVSEDFRLMTDMDRLLVSGSFRLREDVVDFVTLGVGLAQALGARVGFVQPIEIYVPRRNARVNLANISAAFTSASVQIGGTFLLSQPELDEQLGIIPIQLARELFDYEIEVTSLNLKLTSDASVRRVKAEIQRIIGDDFRVETRFEQQREAYRMLQIEKWVTFLILSLILLIAVFNIVGSITMLIEEKKEDIKSLRNLGAPRQMILQVFLYHGWLISLLGAILGIVLGTTVSLLQQHLGFLRLGGAPGTYIVESYPVIVQLTDILITFGIVSLISLFTVFYPVNSRIKHQ